MPLGVLTDDTYERELDSHKSKVNGNVLVISKGRGKISGVPESLRNVIAQEAIQGTPAKEIIEAFGISQSSISAYKNGATSTATYDTPSAPLVEHIDQTKEAISKVARSKMMSALDQITPERMGSIKVKDAASIAKDMSAIIRNMEPDVEDNGPKVQFNIYAPQMKQEESYQIIEVKE